MRWFTADWHFFHGNIIKYENRPYKSVNEMNNALINGINEVVKPEDTLYVLGDLAFIGSSNADKLRKLINKIKCEHLVLILGNHDNLKPFSYVDMGFESVHTSLDIGDYVLIHDPALREAVPHDRKILCGHVHSLFLKVANVVNVGVDVWGQMPVPETKIKGIFASS